MKTSDWFSLQTVTFINGSSVSRTDCVVIARDQRENNFMENMSPLCIYQILLL